MCQGGIGESLYACPICFYSPLEIVLLKQIVTAFEAPGYLALRGRDFGERIDIIRQTRACVQQRKDNYDQHGHREPQHGASIGERGEAAVGQIAAAGLAAVVYRAAHHSIDDILSGPQILCLHEHLHRHLLIGSVEH